MSQAISETMVFHRKAGDGLDEANDGPATRAFGKLASTVKAQSGYRSQYWGPQVENPDLFVWSIAPDLTMKVKDWESLEHHTAFVTSDEYASFQAGLKEAFDLEAGAPFTIYTRWEENAAAAFKSPVTEVAWFILRDGDEEAGADAKATIMKALEPIGDAVITVGKASGAATGWSFPATPYAASARKPGKEWLCGVYGYASIDVHMKWREQEEHEWAVEIFAGLEERGLSLQPADVPGVDPSTGYFHVHFRAGE